MTKLLRFLENAFAVISLILFSQGFFLIFLGDNTESPDKDSFILRTIFQLIYLITVFLLLKRWKKTIKCIPGNSWLFFLIILAIVSVSWSSVPDISLRKIVALIGSTFFGMYLGTKYNFEERLKILGWAFGISVVSNFFFILAIPEYGLMQSVEFQGAWRGIYPHKNGLGESMFISFLTFYMLSISKSGRKYKWTLRLVSLLSVILIYFAESATAFISVVFTYGMIQALKRLSLRSKKNVLLILLALIIALILQVIFVINFQQFLAVNNKDITLSGRTVLWSILWEFIQKHPWLGYGYGAFFSASQPETDVLWQVLEWGPVHAHNGYIQLWINLGFVGCSIFVIGYFYSLFKALFLYLLSKDDKMLWTFTFLSYTVFLNCTEVSFLSFNSIVWTVSLATLFSLNINNNKIIQ